MNNLHPFASTFCSISEYNESYSQFRNPITGLGIKKNKNYKLFNSENIIT